MTLALLTMSRREMDRAELMLRVHKRRLTQVEAATQLGLPCDRSSDLTERSRPAGRQRSCRRSAVDRAASDSYETQ